MLCENGCGRLAPPGEPCCEECSKLRPAGVSEPKSVGESTSEPIPRPELRSESSAPSLLDDRTLGIMLKVICSSLAAEFETNPLFVLPFLSLLMNVLLRAPRPYQAGDMVRMSRAISDKILAVGVCALDVRLEFSKDLETLRLIIQRDAARRVITTRSPYPVTEDLRKTLRLERLD